MTKQGKKLIYQMDSVVISIKPKGEVKIGVVGKYVSLPDAYKSLTEALTHGGIANDVKVKRMGKCGRCGIKRH